MRLRYSRPHSSVPASVQALSPPPPLCLSLSCPAQLPSATPPLILLIHQINLGRLVMTSVLKRKDKERVAMLRQHRQSLSQCFGVALTNEYCRNTLLKDFLIHCSLIFLQLCRYQVQTIRRNQFARDFNPLQMKTLTFCLFAGFSVRIDKFWYLC